MTTTDIVMPEFTSEVMHECPVPGCTRAFPSKNGLQGHMIAHRPPVMCPECGREYKTPGALGNHRKTEHGIEGTTPASVAGRAKTRAKRNGSAPVHVDDVFGSVLQVLWPSGTMPIAAVIPLLQWREATQDFLDQVQS
jgi:hypothetical protein